MTLPVVYLEGEPFEQGRQHGLALREQIVHNLDVYYDRFQREGQLDPDEVRARTARLVPTLERHRDYFAAVRGVADGSGLELVDLAMLNLRYELLYYQYSVLPVGGPDGCTSFAVLPSAAASGHLLMGENWDWIPEVQGAVLYTRGALEALSFTEAGIVGGKIGLNSAGVGLVINGLLTKSDDWARPVTPFHVRCYEILRSASLDAALSAIQDEPRACSANFLLAQAPDHVVNVEASPDRVRSMPPEQGVIAHTNHFVDPRVVGVEEPRSERRPHSYTRLARMRDLLDARRPLSVADVQSCLRDHDNYPDSVCRHEHPDDPPEEACTTVVSAVMDLHEHTLWLAPGPPCEHAYTAHTL